MAFIEQALNMDILSLIECYPLLFIFALPLFTVLFAVEYLAPSHTLFSSFPLLCPILFFFYFCMVMLHASASACSSHLEAAQRKSMSCQCHAASAFHWFLSNSSMGLMSCGKMSHMRTCYVYVNEGAFLC